MRIELLLFLSLLAILVVLIACSVPRRPTSALAPTLFPQLTLTMYDPQLVARVSGNAAIAATVLPSKPDLPEVYISPPRCYRTISPQLTCLGYLRNATDAALAYIRLKARFSGEDGRKIGEATFSLEQSQAAAGSRAPYRLQMPDSRAEHATLEIAFVSAHPASASSLTLDVEGETGRYRRETNNYRYRATLRNGNAVSVSGIRLIISLEDEAGAIVGFRAVDWPIKLASGAALPVDLTITPLAGATSIRHHVIALAQAAALPAELRLSQ